MGELGLGATSRDRNVKRPRLNVHLLAGKVGIVDVAVGGMHVAALDKEGKVWTWGVNDQGSLGRDTKVTMDATMKDSSMEDSDSEDEELLNVLESKPGPVEGFPEGVKVVKLACGDSISVAIADDGMVYSWGTFRVTQQSLRKILTCRPRTGYLDSQSHQWFALDRVQFQCLHRIRYVRSHVEQITFSRSARQDASLHGGMVNNSRWVAVSSNDLDQTD